ncbi:VOC family protein [Hutsoniella sourekii]|uniref:VOC family protein n=1 Tax=Hutsoniella sourekii TaxID=87650 RepID=UPI000485E1D8|nr:VOC family protein [Hutsoniella sourekii]
MTDTIQAITQSQTNITNATIQLNALNPAKLAQFYQEAIGLSLITEDGDYYALGTPGGPALIEIYPTDHTDSSPRAGLYHLALLLPNRSELGDIFKHLLDHSVPLDGASDHGYSEALYLKDPEGNGIEIYADKDRSEWNILDNGLIAGIVEPMDAEGVLASGTGQFKGLSPETILGHVHLHVGNLEETFQFYHQIMGLGLKYIMNGQAAFMATGLSHHQLGVNLWKGKGIPKAKADTQGLRACIWQGSASDLAWIEEQLQAHQVDYQKVNGQLEFSDNSGVPIIVRTI